jgi:hypothetical protein
LSGQSFKPFDAAAQPARYTPNARAVWFAAVVARYLDFVLQTQSRV